MKLVLVRHSKTTFDKDASPVDWRLSPDGIEAAKRLAKCEVFAGSVADVQRTGQRGQANGDGRQAGWQESGQHDER